MSDTTIVYLDDQADLLQTYRSFLEATYHGIVHPIQYTTQSLPSVVADVLTHEPQIIVLDYHLDARLKGRDVCQALRQAGFVGMIVGFSSDPYTEPLFIKAGADEFIEKF